MAQLWIKFQNYIKGLIGGYRHLQTSNELHGWVYDIEAEKKCSHMKYARITGIVAVISLVLAVLYIPLLRHLLPLPLEVFIILLVLAWVSAVIGARIRSKLMNVPICCSKCGRDMDYTEVNHPFDLLNTFGNAQKGGAGRVYLRRSTGQHGQGDLWYRVLQGVRVCNECHRYVIVNPKVMKQLGSTSSMEDAERQAQRIDRAQENMRGKKIIFKKNAD